MEEMLILSQAPCPCSCLLSNHIPMSSSQSSSFPSRFSKDLSPWQDRTAHLTASIHDLLEVTHWAPLLRVILLLSWPFLEIVLTVHCVFPSMEPWNSTRWIHSKLVLLIGLLYLPIPSSSYTFIPVGTAWLSQLDCQQMLCNGGIPSGRPLSNVCWTKPITYELKFSVWR